MNADIFSKGEIRQKVTKIQI